VSNLDRSMHRSLWV